MAAAAIGEKWRIMRLSVTGGATTEVIAESGLRVQDPAWSPDGQRIAYTMESGEGTLVFTARADGTNRHQGSTTSSSEFVSDVSPAWSPEGTQIAFSRCVGVCVANSGIFVVGADGTACAT